MTLVPHGRGGWATSASTLGYRVSLLVVALALGVGCSSSTGKEGAGAGGQGGKLGENQVGGTSLQQYQQGTLGSASGPLKDIHFDFDDYTIRPQDGGILRNNAAWLSANPGTHAQVEGHCDNRGSEEYNIALGAKRAQAAKDYLVTLGISADRLSTISYGKELPLCADDTDECWAMNRRDHFAVSK